MSPDFTFNEKSTKVIEKNQKLYDDFNKALNEIDEIKEPALKAEFKAKIEDYVAKKIKDANAISANEIIEVIEKDENFWHVQELTFVLYHHIQV